MTPECMETTMSEERLRVLNMLAEEKITVDEADRLLRALGESPSAGAYNPRTPAAGTPKFLRVVVEEGGKRTVNVRVPIALLRSGMRLAAVLPDSARDQVDKALGKGGLKLENLPAEEIIEALRELDVEIDDDGKQVRVRCE